jgi:site-specific recombinase
MSDTDIEARKIAALARAEAAKARLAARKPLPELAEVERLEAEATETEAIDAAEAEYGADGYKVVRTNKGIVIVKTPAYVAVKRFHDVGKTSLEAKDKIGRPYVIHPSKEEYAKMAAADAGGAALISAVADAVLTLAGFGQVKLEEKSEA